MHFFLLSITVRKKPAITSHQVCFSSYGTESHRGEQRKKNNINNNGSLKSPYPQKNGLLKKKKKTHWWKTFPFMREEHTAPPLETDMNL